MTYRLLRPPSAIPDRAGPNRAGVGRAGASRAAAGRVVSGCAPASGTVATDGAPVVFDEAQRRVVAHRHGPLMVLGGPGTGKTTVLAAAVAARVDAGVPPERILVLTFGRRAAGRLRSRIEVLLGTRHPTTVAPMVRTFHGYAFGLLRTAAVRAGQPPPRLLSGPEQDVVIREMLAGDPDAAGWPTSLRPALATRAFAQQLRDLLLRAAEREIGPGRLAELGRSTGRPEWVAAARFMRQYEEILALRSATGRAGAAYDSAELVRAAVTLLRDDPQLLARQRERLSMVYVDELADTDPAQLDLLDLVAGQGGDLVAFADPASSTYSFRGADPDAVARFPDRFRAPVVLFTTGYRSSPALLAATGRVAARLRGPARHRLLVPPPAAGPTAGPGDPESSPGAARGAVRSQPAPASRPVVPGQPGGADPPAGAAAPGGGSPAGPGASAGVQVRTFRSATGEAAYVAHRLREAHLIDGVPWDRMAVVVRSTTLALPTLRRALHQAGVPLATLAGDVPVAAAPAVAPLLLALRCAVRPERLDEAAAVALLHSPLGGADPLAERRLRQGLRAMAIAGGDRRPSGVLLVEALRQPVELAAISRRWAAPAQAVARLLAVVRRVAARPTATVEDVLWAAWQASGLTERWGQASVRGGARGAAADRALDAVLVLFDTAARFADRLPGARLEVFLDHVLSQEVPADTLAPAADRGPAVQVLTAHAAKGLEWDLVVVAGVQEGLWPDLRLRGSVLGADELVDLAAGRDLDAVGRVAALLDEERRLFTVAITRARRRLVVTAVASGDGEEQPSRFLRELVAGPSRPDRAGGAGAAGVEAVDGEALEPTALPRALTLPALVAELRRALLDPATPVGRRDGAARQLARLAAAGVPGADPARWWGLAPLSDERPLVDPGEPVVVTPSTVESVQRCSLRWLLERHGGAAPATPEQGVGNLVHAAAMLAGDARVDRAALVEYVAARFDEIELSARWMAGRERRRAEQMIDKLVGWLAANPRRLAAIERDFLARIDEVVRIRGRVDRLEVDEHGRLVVIDLKTGRTTSAGGDDLAEHPQLGAYQAAVAAGAFPDLGDDPGGAALVQLGSHAAAKEQRQAPLADAADPGWAAAMVRRTAATMAAATFQAVANTRCRTCPVRTSCPVSGKGRQVTGEGG